MLSLEPNEAAKGFSDLVSRYVKPENHRGSFNKSIVDNRFINAFYGISNEAHRGVYGGLDEEAILGTLFWQIYTQTEVFKKIIGTDISPKSEFIISTSGLGQYTLLVLDPDFNNPEHYIHEVRFKDKSSIENDIRKWIYNYIGSDSMEKLRVSSFNSYYLKNIPTVLLANDLKQFIFQITKDQKFQIIHIRQPVVESIHCFRSHDCLGVRRVLDQVYSSTAGVIGENIHGQKGITIAYHALMDPQSTETVFIGDYACSIVSKNEISDSCFVVPENDALFHNCLPTNGPLIGKTPRGYQAAEFTGITSGKRKTIIDSWSMDLPFVQPYNQLKVFTKEKANPGDSGSALIDDEGHLIGFAFYVSGFGAPVDFTAWIWAESVFKAHHLKH